MPAFSLIVGLSISVGYLVVFGFALRRAARFQGAYLWLAVTIGLQLAATGAGVLLAGEWRAPVATYLNSGALVAFGGLTFTYLKRPGRGLWLAASGCWFVLQIGADVLGGLPALGAVGWLGKVFAAGYLAGVVTLVGWVLIGLALSVESFYAFFTAHLPEVANRCLFWTTVIPTLLLGVILAATGSSWLVEVGWVLGLLAAAAAAYAVSSHRVLDVRRLLVIGLGFLVATLVTTLVIWGALLLGGSLTTGEPGDVLALGGLALAVATLYVPLRRLAELLVQQIFRPRRDPAQALRQYSQHITAVIDLEAVVQLAMQTLNSVVRVRPGGLILATTDEDGYVRLEPMVSGDQKVLPLIKGRLDPEGAIYRTLLVDYAPLLQFDLEYDRAYADTNPAERGFFEQLRMSAYAPIMAEGSIIGILASGPKLNDEPYQAADLEILATIASQTGIALRNARLVNDLRRLNLELEDANQEFLNLDKVKTDFITIASHELRTPLAQIRGYTDILDALNEHGMLDPAQMGDMTHNLRKASERMEELISNMLDVSKIDVDAMDLHFAQTTMEAIIRLAIEPLTEAIRSRKLSLAARGLRGLPPIEADMQRLVQAFRNIIVNAVRYTPDGGQIDIRAELEQHDGIPDEIHVTICDSGIGIDKQYHDLIFEKFFRVADPSLHSTGATKFMGAGPGLGLTIARGMVEGHGGALWVESDGYDPQRLPGSTFHVVLPVHPPEDARRVMPFEETRHSASTKERAALLEVVQQVQADLAGKAALQPQGSSPESDGA